MAEEAETLKGQHCPMCHKKELELSEKETEVPYFGKLALFSMTCHNCKYHKSDVEALEEKVLSVEKLNEHLDAKSMTKPNS